MFESISFFHNNKTNVNEPIDIGNLVECMLFYGRIEVFANRTILTQLFNYFGIEGIIELLSEELIKINYSAFFSGIQTNNNKGIEYHSPMFGFINNASVQNDIVVVCQELTGKRGKGRRIAQRIIAMITATEPENLVVESAKKLILNQKLIQDFSKSIITDLISEPINLANFQFESEQTPSGIIIETNLDFVQINKIYHKYVPESHSSITRGLILSHILATENEIWLASNSSSEISSSVITSNLIPKKIDYLLDNSIKSSEQLNRFNEFIFDSKSLRECVNQRKVSAPEVISLLKKSKKFKKWISQLDGNIDLIKEYHKEVTKETWVDKLPGKTSRWTIFTTLGLVADFTITGGLGTAIGTGISVLDNFVVDKLIKGWKPNQFIREDLEPLLNK